MGCRDDLEAYLREHGVPFSIHHHPVAYTAQETAAAEHIAGKTLAKVVMAFADDKLVMLALPALYRVDLEKTATALGAKEVRLAHEREFSLRMPGCEVGAMPPFGNLYGIPVHVDRSLEENETIVCQAGTHTDTVSLKYSDFKRLVEPGVIDCAHRPA